MFSGQSPPLITAFTANCTELAQSACVESLARHRGCWQSSERLLQAAERGTHPQKVIQPVLRSVCGTGRGWLMLPRCLTPSLARGCASTSSQGWDPPSKNSSLSPHLREAMKDLWTFWHIFCCCFKVRNSCAEREFWHPGDEQDLDLGVRGEMCRWISAGTMEWCKDFYITLASYCVPTEIIPWLFHADLNDTALLSSWPQVSHSQLSLWLLACDIFIQFTTLINCGINCPCFSSSHLLQTLLPSNCRDLFNHN